MTDPRSPDPDRHSKNWFDRLRVPMTSGRRPKRRSRIQLATDPAIVYAIGDVHGRLDLLLALEARISADAAGRPGEKWIVLLGDVIDRGPSSAQIIDHLLAPPPFGFQRVCLAGNHEAEMSAFVVNPARHWAWLDFGGDATLASYGIERPPRDDTRLRQALASHIPAQHLAFLDALPVSFETPSWLLVHAGLRPGISFATQDDADLIAYRDNLAATYAEFGKLVVHGHTALPEAFISPNRIDIDTSAYATGRLTAVRLMSGADPVLLSTSPSDLEQP